MKPSDDTIAYRQTARRARRRSTTRRPGCRGFESWASVYVFVFGCFVTWVVLLVVLKLVFS